MSEHSAAWWEELRRQMPVARRRAYFDHAAVAPISGPAQQALAEWSADSAANGDVPWLTWASGVERLRRRFAAFLAAGEDEIALVPNTTVGINIVAEGFPWQPGDNVVVPDDEFPSNLFPWLNLESRGVEVRRVQSGGRRLDLDKLAAACDRKTRIVSASWVGYAHGFRTNVDDLCAMVHEQGALLFLDAIQGLGVFPLDVSRTPVDFLAADGHKWLLGPEGAGMFYMRREHLARLEPRGVGWHSVEQAADYSLAEFRLRDAASRYEGGSMNIPGFLALDASLAMLGHYGAHAVSERVLAITDYLCARLEGIGAVVASDRDRQCASGIVSFDVPDRDSAQLRKQCLKADVVVSVRGGRLRASPHAYTSEQDVDRLIAVLDGS